MNYNIIETYTHQIKDTIQDIITMDIFNFKSSVFKLLKQIYWEL